MRRIAMALCILAAVAPAVAIAQPADLPIAAATTTEYPPGVKVRQTAKGPVYTDARGRTLYGMDMRVLLRWAPNPALYCQDDCAKSWEPLLAPPDAQPNIMYPPGFGDRARASARPGGAPAGGVAAAQPRLQAERAPGQAPLPEGFVLPQRAPDWTVIAGPTGPQWVYKGWHMVYTRKNDRPGSTGYDGAGQYTWNTLKFVPPIPEVTTPPGLTTAFAEGAYVVTDKNGRALFTGDCATMCPWIPLAAPAASRAVGDWSVNLAGDRPQWSWRGKPVYVSQEDNPMAAPATGKLVKP
ncbi:MAG: hypothetical protein AB7F98_03530 [Novosphingobium sp.]